MHISGISTIPGNEDEQVPYGKVFTGEEINQALLSENPQEIVPSLDENGHGTAMAGLAAGNFVPTENFSGAAPKATIIVVKLKESKILSEKNFYQYPPQAPVFQEDDIMLGISFAVKMAQEIGNAGFRLSGTWQPIRAHMLVTVS